MSNENRILVIGNGFDLALGYDTRYKDFIHFIEYTRGKGSNDINQEREIDFLHRCKSSYDKITKLDSYQRFVDITNNNCFVKHFIATKYDINQWADVEEEMHRMINSIKSVFNDNCNKILFKDSTNKSCLINDVDKYTINTLLEFNLVQERVLSTPPVNYYYIINDEYYDSVYKIKWTNLNNFLNRQLNEFKEILTIYLRDFVPILKSLFENRITIDEIKNDLKPDYLITFNYTNYSQEILKKDAIYIHGSLIENNIVLGYDKDIDDGVEYIRFQKFFQRIQNKLPLIDKKDHMFNVKSDVDYNYSRPINAKKKNTVIFYGVSFDVTDKDYIKTFYKAPNNAKVIIYYYNDEDYDQKIINLIKIFDGDSDMITNDIHRRYLEMKKISK